MRILKFRAFNNNVMGEPFTLEQISTFEVNSDRIGSTWPEGTVFMQYTGLKDKKRTKEFPDGQPIYEGDVIEFLDGITVVKFEEGSFVLEALETFAGVGIKYNLAHHIRTCEVVGNIHENPELLN